MFQRGSNRAQRFAHAVGQRSQQGISTRCGLPCVSHVFHRENKPGDVTLRAGNRRHRCFDHLA